MKKLIYLSVLTALFFACKGAKNNQGNSSTANLSKDFIPYSIGTYWVYESTNEGIVDTLKVISHEETEKGIKVDLNTEKWLIVSEDSVFVRCNTRGGGEFTMPLYLRVKDKMEYGTCMGDVVTKVEAQKLMGPQVINGKAYIDCTEYFIKPYKKVIVADRVGPIKYTYLDLDGKVQSERILKDFYLQKQ